MNSLESELYQEIGWRVNEISIIRTIPLIGNLKNYQNEVIIKYSTVAIYSLWEGFVVTSLGQYLREINKLGIDTEKIHPTLRAHDLDIKFEFDSVRTDFNKKVTMVNEIHNYFSDIIILDVNIPTNSNVNFKRINIILNRLNIPIMDEKLHKKRLNKLVFLRNKIAHGENSIPICSGMIEELSFTVIDAMNDLTCNIIDAYENKSYLR